MKRAISALFLLVFAGFGQSRSRMVDYALMLEDAPGSSNDPGPAGPSERGAQAQTARIREAQSGLLAELRAAKCRWKALRKFW